MKTRKERRSRCRFCRKKLPVIPFACDRCKQKFCSAHYHDFNHNCMGPLKKKEIFLTGAIPVKVAKI